METPVEPTVDPTSIYGHIRVSREFIVARFHGAPNDVLRAHFVGQSPSGNWFWFQDHAELRVELGMPPKEGRER
jgi:hypothetical protein